MAPKNVITKDQVDAARTYLATLDREELEDCVMHVVLNSLDPGDADTRERLAVDPR
ncbi:hypothetical protein ACIGKR_23900 [Rhodococcus qingshengii]|uniref:hypothetical protein n=1 Tax=Rhodococcus qingshengii TaxID=334542 RepID=UPI0037C64DE8